MNGIQIAVIAILVLVIVVLLCELFLARFMATLIFTPPKSFCPTEEQVKERKVNEFASDYEMYLDTDFDAYGQWETEYFTCDNQGVQIEAVYHPVEHAKGCVIIAHGFGQNRFAMVPYAEIFRNMGFSTLLFDQRRFGKSTAPFGSMGDLEATDIVALIHWVKEHCGRETKIILHGVSMGAVSIMNALQYTDEIDYVIEDCGFARMLSELPVLYKSMLHTPNPFLIGCIRRRGKKFGVNIDGNNPIDAVKNTNIPICVVHGDADTAVSVASAKELGKVLKNPKSKVEIYPGREHAYAICDKERYIQMLKDFLQDVK